MIHCILALVLAQTPQTVEPPLAQPRVQREVVTQYCPPGRPCPSCFGGFGFGFGFGYAVPRPFVGFSYAPNPVIEFPSPIAQQALGIYGFQNRRLFGNRFFRR